MSDHIIRTPGRVEHAPGVYTSAEGHSATNLWSLKALRSALRLEEKTGMRLSRGRSALAVAKTRTGLRSNKRMVHIAKLDEMIAEQEQYVSYETK